MLSYLDTLVFSRVRNFENDAVVLSEHSERRICNLKKEKAGDRVIAG